MLQSPDVTGWLIQWSQGDESALQKLTPVVYSELHRLAAGYLRNERDDHTLQATALVHEAYLHLRKLDKVEWKNRSQFIAIAAQAMRHILVDHSRRRNAEKRGGDQAKMPLQESDRPAKELDFNLVVLDQALDKLANQFPRHARVVELRFFGGLTSEETAEVLHGTEDGVSSRTVERDWRFARAWLHKAMSGRELPA
ncbi:MAG TPA: sigma-70 family RNA polymerase sigma factor [Bryobacteraceae bacterium]|nr:sigma-70 family RNA polymerase sigma factor [Bryobacteraceae bacterium]